MVATRTSLRRRGSTTLLKQRLQLALLNRVSRKGSLAEKGFTLVELMVVIVIVGILAAVALPNFMSQTKKAAATEASQQVSAISKQAATYMMEQGSLGTVDADCSTYAGTVTSAGRKFTYACSGTATAFVVTATGKAATTDAGGDNNSAGVTVTMTSDIAQGTFGKPVVAGI
jgi:type IV pilus assembly protein PilA